MAARAVALLAFAGREDDESDDADRALVGAGLLAALTKHIEQIARDIATIKGALTRR